MWDDTAKHKALALLDNLSIRSLDKVLAAGSFVGAASVDDTIQREPQR